MKDNAWAVLDWAIDHDARVDRYNAGIPENDATTLRLPRIFVPNSTKVTNKIRKQLVHIGKGCLSDLHFDNLDPRKQLFQDIAMHLQNGSFGFRIKGTTGDETLNGVMKKCLCAPRFGLRRGEQTLTLRVDE